MSALRRASETIIAIKKELLMLGKMWTDISIHTYMNKNTEFESLRMIMPYIWEGNTAQTIAQANPIVLEYAIYMHNKT